MGHSGNCIELFWKPYLRWMMKCQVLDNRSPKGFIWYAIKSLILLENEHTQTHKTVGELFKSWCLVTELSVLSRHSRQLQYVHLNHFFLHLVYTCSKPQFAKTIRWSVYLEDIQIYKVISRRWMKGESRWSGPRTCRRAPYKNLIYQMSAGILCWMMKKLMAL